MIYLFVAINIGWLFVWYCFARREIPLTLFSILKDIAPYFLLAASLTIAAHYITSGITNLYLSLTIKVFFVASICTCFVENAISHFQGMYSVH